MNFKRKDLSTIGINSSSHQSLIVASDMPNTSTLITQDMPQKTVYIIRRVIEQTLANKWYLQWLVDLWQELTPDFKLLSTPLFKKRVKQYLLIANEQPRKDARLQGGSLIKMCTIVPGAEKNLESV